MERTGERTTLPADLILLSIGFIGHDAPEVSQQLEIETEYGLVPADWGHLVTSDERVFVAGDMRRGASLIVWAMAEGRGAAREIDRLLISLLSGTDLRQPRQGSVVIWVSLEGHEMLGFCLFHAPEGKVLNPQLPLGPGDALLRTPICFPRLDGPFEILHGVLDHAVEYVLRLDPRPQCGP